MTATGLVRRIMVGVDGSAASLDALHWAVGLAHASGGEVTAVHAFTPSASELSPDYYKVLRVEAGPYGWRRPERGAIAGIDVA